MPFADQPRVYDFVQEPTAAELREVIAEIEELQHTHIYPLNAPALVEFREPTTIFKGSHSREMTQAWLRLAVSPEYNTPCYYSAPHTLMNMDDRDVRSWRSITLFPSGYEDPVVWAEKFHEFLHAIHKNAWQDLKESGEALRFSMAELKLRKVPKLPEAARTALRQAFKERRNYVFTQPADVFYDIPQIQVETRLDSDGVFRAFLREQKVRMERVGEREDGRPLLKPVFLGSGQEWKLLGPAHAAISSWFTFPGDPAPAVR